MIRGKGSVKEGKVGRKDGQMLPGEDEPLHALVTANTMENVKKAVEQVGRHRRHQRPHKNDPPPEEAVVFSFPLRALHSCQISVFRFATF